LGEKAFRPVLSCFYSPLVENHGEICVNSTRKCVPNDAGWISPFKGER